MLIVGTGLTMVDVALALSQEGGRVPLVRTISRHGLLPLGQTIFRPTAVQGRGEDLLSQSGSMRRVLAASRALSAKGRAWAAIGVKWLPSSAISRRGSGSGYRRRSGGFLRHAQCHWDVHRHRLPPHMAARIEHMRESERLKVYAGRIRELIPEGEELRVIWRRRGSLENGELCGGCGDQCHRS